MSLNDFSQCRLCPRECGVNRLAGEKGFCGETADLRIGSIVAHFGEEPPISGNDGSGTVFFSGCPTGCFFCQNHQLSKESIGNVFTQEQFHKSMKELIVSEVHNINFVTPDHFWPYIRSLISRLWDEGIKKPFIMNSSGYHNGKIVKEWASYIDIFLPDFKYASPELSFSCMGRRDYVEKALESITEMVDLAGFLDVPVDSLENTASSGVLVRHLVLPGHVDNSIKALELLCERFGRMLPLSVMSQYRPTPFCKNNEVFNRVLQKEEFDRVIDCVETLGFSNVLFQPLSDEDSGFSPDFTLEDPFPGNKYC
jgi:putative pyruvate formate lyase activating enzyme